MKKILRKEMLNKRKNISIEEVNKLSEDIYKNLVGSDLFDKSNIIMIYSDFRNEVKTEKIIKECFSQGKKVILPISKKEDYELIPCEVNSLNELHVGEYGILEPSCEKVIKRDQIDMVLVPGVAFDKSGYRMGYGAGYYDRFLKDYKGIKVGLCYSFQIMDNIYKSEFDINMNYLITEEGILKTGD